MARVRYDPSLFDTAAPAAKPAAGGRVKFDPNLFAPADFSNVQSGGFTRTAPEDDVGPPAPYIEGRGDDPGIPNRAQNRPVTITAPPYRTWGEAALDRGLAIGRNALGIARGFVEEDAKTYPFPGARLMSQVGALAGRAGWDKAKAVSDWIEANVDRENFSDQLALKIKEMEGDAGAQQSDREKFNQQALGSAWKGGVWETAKFLGSNPGQAASLGVDSIPYFAAGGGAGAGLKVAGAGVKTATAGALGAEVGLTSMAAKQQARDEVLQMDPEELAQAPDFAGLEREFGPSKAREVLAERAGNVAAISQAVIGAATAGATSRLSAFERTVAGAERQAGKGAFRAGAEGVAKETVQEGTQGAGEQLSQNIGVSGVDPTRGLTEGVGASALLEAAAGAPTGAVAALPQMVRTGDPDVDAGAKAMRDAIAKAQQQTITPPPAAAPVAQPAPVQPAAAAPAPVPVEPNVPQPDEVRSLLVAKAKEQFDAAGAAELAQARATGGEAATLPMERTQQLAEDVAAEWGVDPGEILRNERAPEAIAPAPQPEPAPIETPQQAPVAAAPETMPAPAGRYAAPEPVQAAEVEPEAAPVAVQQDDDVARLESREELRSRMFGRLRDEIGWDQRGGQMLRAKADWQEGQTDDGGLDSRPAGEVVGRTAWVGKAGPDGQPSGFWRARPDQRMTAKQAEVAFDKAAAGRALSPLEGRFIEYANRTAEQYADEWEAAELEGRAIAVEADDDGVRAVLESDPDMGGAGSLYDRAAYSDPANAEARSGEDWARAALEAGVDPDTIAGVAFDAPTRADQARELARLIQERRQANAGQGGRARGNRIRGRGARGGAEVEGRGAAEAPAAPAEPEGEGEAPLRSQRPGADLFAAPTAKDEVRAKSEAVADRLRGGGTAATMRQGAGDLFAGPRPEQTRIPDAEPKSTAPAQITISLDIPKLSAGRLDKLTIPVETADGKKAEVNAYDALRRAVKRVNVLNQLMGCVRG